MAVDGTDIMGIRPSELTLPYAISGDMSPDVAAIVTERAPNTMLYDQRSIIQTLQYFEANLRPLRTLYALAAMVQERRHEIDAKRTYHLERHGVFDAIIDLPGARVMVRDGLRPFDLDASNWLTRPMHALYMCRAITTTVKDSVLAVEAGMSYGARSSVSGDSRLTGQDSGTLPAYGEGFDLATMVGDLR